MAQIIPLPFIREAISQELYELCSVHFHVKPSGYSAIAENLGNFDWTKLKSALPLIAIVALDREIRVIDDLVVKEAIGKKGKFRAVYENAQKLGYSGPCINEFANYMTQRARGNI